MTTKPYWTKLPTYSLVGDADRFGNGGRLPASLLAYDEDEDRAYHRVNGLTWRPRVKPETPVNGRHPRSAYRSLPSIPAKMKTLSNQVRMAFA